MTNEIGPAPPRGRSSIPRDEAERELSAIAGKPITLPANAVAHAGPSTCPACGSRDVIWGCDPRVERSREQIHPLIWHETKWMADSFLCGECWAGWIEPDEPLPITWVRPYWRE